MTDDSIKESLVKYAHDYNDRRYFEEDPISFPRRFFELAKHGKACREDVEIAALLAAHLAWGRRQMIVRDCTRLFEQMDWKPYDYVMKGVYRTGCDSAHRTITWDELAAICGRIRAIYTSGRKMASLSVEEFRCGIYGGKLDRNAANKKINMMRRWMVRRDGIVDLGIWEELSPKDLLIPLDVHVHDTALSLGLTSRKGANARTVEEITSAFREIFPDDPCLGDFALFGYGITH